MKMAMYIFDYHISVGWKLLQLWGFHKLMIFTPKVSSLATYYIICAKEPNICSWFFNVQKFILQSTLKIVAKMEIRNKASHFPLQLKAQRSEKYQTLFQLILFSMTSLPNLQSWSKQFSNKINYIIGGLILT